MAYQTGAQPMEILSMSKLYSFNGQLVTLSREQVVDHIYAAEKKTRTDKFKYIDQQAFNSQVEEIKTSWPENYKEAIKTKAREIAGQGNPITPTIIRRAIVAFGVLLAADRAKVSTKQVESELRYVSGEIALASLFRRAPDAGAASLFSRKYQDNGKSIRVKPATSPKNIVVNISEATAPDSADRYVLALFVEELQSSLLLGYATKEDVVKAKTENLAYYIPLEALRPMSALYLESGLTEIPVGISFESIPALQQIPIPAKIQDMKKGQSKDEFDFFASVGLKPAAPAVAVAAPDSAITDL